MKYDCTKTQDCIHEYHRVCDSHPAGCENDCPFCGVSEICNFDIFESEDKIALLQKWSDEHPEPLKLTKREYEFLTTFTPGIDKKAIERIPNKGLYSAFYHEMNDEIKDEWEAYVDGYAEGYRINPELFKFINEGERWYFDKLLSLEVTE